MIRLDSWSCKRRQIQNQTELVSRFVEKLLLYVQNRR